MTTPRLAGTYAGIARAIARTESRALRAFLHARPGPLPRCAPLRLPELTPAEVRTWRKDQAARTARGYPERSTW